LDDIYHGGHLYFEKLWSFDELLDIDVNEVSGDFSQVSKVKEEGSFKEEKGILETNPSGHHHDHDILESFEKVLAGKVERLNRKWS